LDQLELKIIGFMDYQKNWASLGNFANFSNIKRSFVNCNGFTLTELMVVTALFSITSAIAIPSFLAFQPQMRLNGATREVFSKLNYARAQAVEKNTTYKVVVPNNHTITTWLDSDADDIVDVAESSDAVDIQLHYSDVTIAVSDTTPVQFNSRGTTNGARTYILTRGSSTKTIAVSVTGHVKIN
jgi:prepilin-type N-terminal cleavage/methylation domain-containing protein